MSLQDAAWAGSRLVRSRKVHLGELADLLGRRHPRRTLIRELHPSPATSGRQAWTGQALARDVNALAGTFSELEGRPVMIVLDNRVDLLLTILGVARAGGLPAPVSNRLGDEELAAVAQATDAKDAVTDAASRQRLARAIGSRAGLRVLDPDAFRPDLCEIPSAARARRDPTAVALYLTTSGTTGLPKAASLTSQGLLGGFGPLACLPLGTYPRPGRDALLSALPLTHVMGLSVALGALFAGVPWLHHPRFDASAMLDAFERWRPNAFVGVPTMYADLEAEGASERDLSSVQLWISGADVMPLERARRFQTYGAAFRVAGRGVGVAGFLDGYGMVELSGPAAFRLLPPALHTRLSMAPPYLPLPGMRVRTVDASGWPLRWGRLGELQFRGPGVLRGYRGQRKGGPDLQGWFSTGDYGRAWPAGVFSFAGRHRDRLKVGGFSVFPAEVEAILEKHPQVAEVALVGLPEPRLGERPVAVVVPADDAFDREAFVAWAQARVAGYRRPREVAVVSSLPRGAHGKLNRAQATRVAEAALGDS